IAVARREQFMSRPPDGAVAAFAEGRRLNSLDDYIRDRAVFAGLKVGTIPISAGCCANATIYPPVLLSRGAPAAARPGARVPGHARGDGAAWPTRSVHRQPSDGRMTQ